MRMLLALIGCCLIFLTACGGGGGGGGSTSEFPPLTDAEISSAEAFPTKTSIEGDELYWHDAPYSYVSKIVPSETATYRLRVGMALETDYHNASLVLYDSNGEVVKGIHADPSAQINLSYWISNNYNDLGIDSSYPLFEFTLVAGEVYYFKGTALTSSPELVLGYSVESKSVVSTADNDPGGIGDISFSLVWTHTGSSRAEGPDIDLWVVDPLGHRLSTSRDGFSLGPEPEGGIIDFDDLGGWGDGDGEGPERAYWPSGSSPSGSYQYGVRYYQGDGTANYTLRVYKNGVLVSTDTGILSAVGSDIVVDSVSN